MKNESKRTPGEWEFDGKRQIKHADGIIAIIEPLYLANPNEAKANAEHIVKCVNSYDEMVAALQDAKDYFSVCDKNCIPVDLFKKIKSALKNS